MTVKTQCNKIFIFQINAVLSNFLKNPEKKSFTVSTKTWSRTTVFNINNKKHSFFQQQIILEWFLKDHVTLKTGTMMLTQKFSFDQRNKLHSKIYSIRKCLFWIVIIFQNIYCIFDHINTALVNIRDSRTHAHTLRGGLLTNICNKFFSAGLCV